jgi:hypothetical protein
MKLGLFFATSVATFLAAGCGTSVTIEDGGDGGGSATSAAEQLRAAAANERGRIVARVGVGAPTRQVLRALLGFWRRDGGLRPAFGGFSRSSANDLATIVAILRLGSRRRFFRPSRRETLGPCGGTAR